MCGIAGFTRWAALEPADLATLTDALRHRGPDDQGAWFHPESATALGHRRLSILDTSPAGHQPMTSGDSGLWIVFNGEIFNFLELRQELGGLGHRFHTESDTEVVLAAWREWGQQAFRRFNGMWALALFDARAGTLLLCRDRFGVKPLYFARSGPGLAFASECKALWALRGKLGLGWDGRGLRTALTDPFGLESTGHTLFDKVECLLPGHLLEVGPDGTRVSRWWNTLDELPAVPAGFEEQAERFRELFLDACALRMRSDVPIGTALSGGLDSSSVLVALAHQAGVRPGDRAARDWRRAFFHAFPGTLLDETRWARLVADAAGVEMVTVEGDAAASAEEADRVLLALEGVIPGMADAPWRIYRAERQQGVVVSLDGHGADELLAGYPQHLFAAMGAVPPWSSRFRDLFAQYREQLGPAAPSALRRLVATLPWRPGLRALLDRTGATGLLRRAPAYRTFLSGDAERLSPYPRRATELPADWSPLRALLYQDFHHLVLPRILQNFDRMSMAHGVEVRMPFLDWRLVTYCFALGDEAKLAGGYGKRVLRQAMRGLLPEELRLRKSKVGFNSPLPQWFGGGLDTWVGAALEGGGPVAPFLDLTALRAFRKSRQQSGAWSWEDAQRIWTCASALRLGRLMGGAAA